VLAFFDSDKIVDFEFRRKRGDYLLSKKRFLPAQFLASLEQADGLNYASTSTR
jgi:threonine aldolase